MNQILQIDGSFGGGSVIRVAVPIALATGKSLNIINIRKNRKKPGLRLQHLSGLKLLAEITGSKLNHSEIGSQEISIETNTDPTKFKDSITVHLDTAASISLIVQAIANYTFMSKRSITLQFIGGGTVTSWAPTCSYLQYITKPIFLKFGLEINIDIKLDGYYPRGGAEGTIQLNWIGSPLTSVAFNTYTDWKVTLFGQASQDLERQKVIERQIEAYQENFNQPIETIENYLPSKSAGTNLLAIIESKDTIKGLTELGKIGRKSEEIGKTLAKKTTEE
ncbi:MAG: hypothetical protein OEZ01_12580, partial [Candidatus Heimdallarchaeota archaeon]|nr:hypothetical protein [Candidatus Heimdallarchaeota archaeon]